MNDEMPSWLKSFLKEVMLRCIGIFKKWIEDEVK